MRAYRITLQTLTAFGTPLAGDTLFGQLCWTLRDLYGAARLEALLAGYTDQQPFLVVSDAFPAGFLPLPTLPSPFWTTDATAERKALKKKRWLPLAQSTSELAGWQALALSDAEVAAAITVPAESPAGARPPAAVLAIHASQPHNTINRLTGTTGKDGFAPYSVDQIWYHPDALHDLYVVLDTERMSLEELSAALAYIGATGYGRDASIGLGKFCLAGEPVPFSPAAPAGANAWLTLAPCAPQGQGFDSRRSYYQSTTRFGRHGGAAALCGQPFKRPVLLAKSGAVLAPLAGFDASRRHVGQGLGAVSHVQTEAVHQGYAPVIPICLPDHQGAET